MILVLLNVFASLVALCSGQLFQSGFCAGVAASALVMKTAWWMADRHERRR